MPATQLRRPPSPPRKGFNHGLLVARNREIDASETACAPGWQGAEEGEYREYLTDERRSQAGCIDARSGIESPVTGH